MKNFIKIINPTRSTDIWNKTPFDNHIKIEHTNGELSMVGVMGAMSNGDCKGHAGQCINTICDLNNKYYNTKLTNDLTENDLKKLVNIWNEYHLNNMKPYDMKMKELGWDKIAEKLIYEINLKLKTEIWKLQNEIKNRCIKSLKETGSAIISETEKKLLNLKYSKTIYSYDENKFDIPKYYEVDKDFKTKCPKIKKTTLGWISPKKHPDGILGKLCEESGNKYGHVWYKHKVPENILKWLYDLPDAKKQPAWI